MLIQAISRLRDLSSKSQRLNAFLYNIKDICIKKCDTQFTKCKFFKNNFYASTLRSNFALHAYAILFFKVTATRATKPWHSIIWFCYFLLSWPPAVYRGGVTRHVSTQLTILVIVRHIAFRWTHPSSACTERRSTSTPRRCIFVQRPSCGW